RLTGQFVTDPTHATAFFSVDVKTGRVDTELYDLFDLDIGKVAELHKSTEVIGETSEHKDTFGLPTHIPVIAGGIDAIVAGVGLGATRVADAALIVGTSSALEVVTKSPVIDPKERFITNFHVIPNRWLISAVQNTSGALLRWFRDIIWNPFEIKRVFTGENPYELMTELAAQSPPGANGLLLLPYFAGERTPTWDPYAKGVFFGLSLHHSIPDLVRAFLESSALALLHNTITLSELNVNIKKITIAGGPARSKLWNQIRADALGKRILKAAGNHPENRGAAILAGLGTKIISGKDMANWNHITETYFPKKKITFFYRRLVQIYMKLYRQTHTLMQEIEKLTSDH
ncbi:MAG: xylulokinase, partial [Candidatus Ranarchaeia archaeon]